MARKDEEEGGPVARSTWPQAKRYRRDVDRLERLNRQAQHNRALIPQAMYKILEFCLISIISMQLAAATRASLSI